MNKPLNICLISREYPPETDWGGIGRYTHHLACGLADKGHEVHVVCQSLDGEREYAYPNLNVHRITHPVLFPFKGKLNEFALRLEYSRRVHQKICQINAQNKIDIIEGPNLSAELFVHSLSRVAPIVTRLHTHFSEVIQFCDWQKTFDRRLSCWLEDATIRRSDLVTCSTESHAELISNETGFNKDRINIIPLGIPVPELESGPEAENNPPRILFIGRLEKRKGAHILMKAVPLILEEFPEAEFLIIGRDTFLDRQSSLFEGSENISFKSFMLRGLPESCLNKIKFLGYIENSRLGDHLRSCDIFVAPSLYESFGLVYLEAMSHAKPVIGCGVGGVPEVVEDNVTGLLVPPEDSESLAIAAIELLKNSGRRKELGTAARSKVEESFGLERMIERTVEAYSRLI